MSAVRPRFEGSPTVCGGALAEVVWGGGRPSPREANCVHHALGPIQYVPMYWGCSFQFADLFVNRLFFGSVKDPLNFNNYKYVFVSFLSSHSL